MREIITVQVGCGGNAIAEKFFKVISDEHGLDKDGNYIGTNNLELERINVFFKECNKKYYIRAIGVDTDPESIDKLSTGRIGAFYFPANLIKGNGGTGNNYAKGYYDLGKKLMSPVMNSIRLEIESADSVQGIQVIHTLGGGTGSGLSGLIWDRMVDEYRENIIQTVSVIPSTKFSDAVIEPYNCVHCFPHLFECTDLTFCIDNEALYNICTKRINLDTPSYRDTNHLTAHALSGVTTCLRFPGQLNTVLRKLYVNMVPFPNLHFLVPSFSPLTTCHFKTQKKLNIKEMVMEIFNTTNMFADIDLHKNKLLTVAGIFRGVISQTDVDFLIEKIKDKHTEVFSAWIPNNIKTEFYDIPPIGLKRSATFLGNTTGIKKLFTRIDDQFAAMYSRKAYLHWYTEHGMEEAQFEQSHHKLYDLLQEYQTQAFELPVLNSKIFSNEL